jgi:hypothetical protein
VHLSRLCRFAFLLLVIPGCSLTDYGYMREGEPHALQIVQFVGWQWKPEELISEADPRMLKALPESEIAKMMSECSAELGILDEVDPVAGQVTRSTEIPDRSALYTFNVKGRKGKSAVVQIRLQKQDESWKVLGFWVQIKTANTQQSSHP